MAQKISIRRKQPLLYICSIATLLLSFADAPALFEPVPDQSGLVIHSPSLSERKTAKIRLANGLEAYLISDPEVDQSAAALAVEAGSWNDPLEYPGMAHFLEHMLFMGTKAYPQEFEYMQYINDHGGKVNAYTASDRTVYMFSINNDGFEGALNRFAHFFIDPLFNPHCIERELLAVDQEHAKNIENDGWRQYMILKETGNPQHPNAKFSTGNADTLRGIPQSAMKAWYKEHYSADKMNLVVLSSLPIDELIEATVKDFSDITSNAQTQSLSLAPLTSEKQRGHMIYIKPVKGLKVLSLTWELPPSLSEDKEAQVGELLSYVLSSGNKNGLLALLKKEHLAESIRVSEEPLSKINKLFSIDVELSDKGLEQVNTVVTYCFEALARLKKTGIPRYIFNDVQKIAEINYEYQSRQDAYQCVLEKAHALVDEDLETFPRKTLIPTKYEPELISTYIDYLTPENCIFFCIADPSKTHVSPNREEKWMKAEYAIVPVAQKQLVAWNDSNLNPLIGLPAANQFIPKNLSLVNTIPSEEQIIPTLLQNNSQGKIYFADDKQYLAPEIAHLFRIKSPLLDGSAKAKTLCDLYIRALDDQIFPITSAAETVGFQIALKQDFGALSLAINGFSDQSSKLAEEIFSALPKVRPSREQFELYKQSALSSYENMAKELPLLQSFEYLNSIIFNDCPTSYEKAKALKGISYEEFLEFCADLFKKAYTEGLLYGNLTRKEADTLWASLKQKLNADGYPVDDQHKRRILVLKDGQGPFMLTQSTPMLGNAALLVVEQGSYSYDKRAAQQILGSILKDGFFETLRTKQQTAYIAKAWDKEEEKQLLQYFAVQSSTHQPNDLIARFELFLENFIKQFTTELPFERFEKVRKMAIASLEMPPENIALMGTRLFILGFDHDGDFQLINKRIGSLEKLTYDQIRKEAEETLSRRNTRRIAILCEGMTPKEKDFRYELTTKEDLQSHGTFVAWR
ncbi:MAG: insulinase family protein [Verrucomicrobia bacterium]|nr:insulinase family protein [Verrucomicrobiota bacterium]